MQVRLIDPDLIRLLAEIGRETAEEPMELLFDDEPLDHILYGVGERGPTPVGIYGISHRYLSEIRAALERRNAQAAIAACAALAASDCPLSIVACGELSALLTVIIPQIPDPVLPADLRPLQTLLEKIWGIAVERRRADLQRAIGAPLYRWYEHHGIYSKARHVLGSLLEIGAEQGVPYEQAILWNNLGFEFLLERRFEEAIADFDRAARLFEQMGDEAQRANSLANCWICRFESGAVEDLDEAETELKKLAQSLALHRFWQARKPFILLARISERRGRIGEAVEFAKRAIQSASGRGTRYPEVDGEYLSRLEALLASG